VAAVENEKRMIRARHVPFWVGFVRLMYKSLFRIFFREVTIVGELKTEDKSVLLLGNHFSWWDGFFADHVNALLFRKNLHIMMLEDQLKPRMFLNKAGAFSIQPGGRGIATSLAYAAEVLQKKDSFLVMYPQGKIESDKQSPLVFQPGLMRIIEKTEGNFQFVFLVALVDYFSHACPSARLYLKEYHYEAGQDIRTIENHYNAFFRECVLEQNNLSHG